MKITLYTGLACALLGGAVGLGICAYSDQRGEQLACSTEFNFTRNKGRASEVKVNTIAQFYFRRNGTGLTAYKGAAATEGRNMIIDRDVDFSWERRQDDNVVVLTYTKTWRRHNDNTPDEIWGSFASPTARYYLTISELSPEVWLIQDRRYPTYICRGQ
ncbi:hypothetical protein EGM70_05985 [Enterobacteriaceae bacterium 89]|nr:hypothetical protein [Enterobacteriaceae bacterium 89]